MQGLQFSGFGPCAEAEDDDGHDDHPRGERPEFLDDAAVFVCPDDEGDGEKEGESGGEGGASGGTKGGGGGE